MSNLAEDERFLAAITALETVNERELSGVEKDRFAFQAIKLFMDAVESSPDYLKALAQTYRGRRTDGHLIDADPDSDEHGKVQFSRYGLHWGIKYTFTETEQTLVVETYRVNIDNSLTTQKAHLISRRDEEQPPSPNAQVSYLGIQTAPLTNIDNQKNNILACRKVGNVFKILRGNK